MAGHGNRLRIVEVLEIKAVIGSANGNRTRI
jgi:hypothetical protein